MSSASSIPHRFRGGRPPGGDAAAGPGLRLAGTGRREPSATATDAPPPRVSEAADPRWVLAVRTAEALEGPVLVPEKRERLLAVGAAVGLTPFDTALVIAMVQDQARRGVAPRQCPAAAEPQLRHVPRPAVRKLPWRSIALGVAGALALEAVVLWWVWG